MRRHRISSVKILKRKRTIVPLILNKMCTEELDEVFGQLFGNGKYQPECKFFSLERSLLLKVGIYKENNAAVCIWCLYCIVGILRDLVFTIQILEAVTPYLITDYNRHTSDMYLR